MTEDKYVTIDQVAQHFLVSISTIRAWVRTGVIPKTHYLKVGNTFRFRLPEVDAAVRAYNVAKQRRPDPVPEITTDQDA